MITRNNLYHITLTGGIHAILFIIFIAILYFTIIIDLKNNVSSDFLVRGAKKYELDKININKIPKFDVFMKILEEEKQKEQKAFESYNYSLKMKTIKLITGIILIYILFMTIMPILFNLKHMDFDHNKILKEIILIILVVGTYELLFLKYIVLDYSFYNFHKFLYKYLANNVRNIKKYLPSIILHFIIDIPEYAEFIPNNIIKMMM